MDRTPSQARLRQCPRSPSGSSSLTSASRMTSASANSSSSQIATSPQMSHPPSHAAHRYSHGQCITGSPRPMSRPTPSLFRRDSIDSTRQSTTISSFLQEKLQRERKAEVEKLNQSQSSLSGTNPDTNASIDQLGRAPGSPLKTSASEFNRPSSSAGYETGKKKGHGVKEMEQVISTLHKQNFDLKLELYHRRERQSTLEERLDALESDKVRMEEINDGLLIELEKRDKAVEEAVAMIINLETKIDQLFRERTMVQQIENEPYFCPRDYDVGGFQTPVARRSGSINANNVDDDAKFVNRMPSFLSDHSETTENLRNVYLNRKGSLLSLTRMAESSPATDNTRALGSPSLSMLSESSFVSIYGLKDKSLARDQEANTNADDMSLQLDDAGDPPSNRTPAESLAERGKACSVSSSRTAGSRKSSSGQFHPITDVVGKSPLQRLERAVDASYSSRRDPGQRQVQDKDSTTVQLASQARPAGQTATRQNKRDALRKVLTDGSGGVRLKDQGLPPTPDTIASSTLRGLQDSDDAPLREEADAHNARGNEQGERGNGVWLNGAAHGGVLQNSQTAMLPKSAQAEMESWASPSRCTMESLFDHRGALIGRPRSAGESTATSHREGRGWDSDNEDDSDTQSLQSSLDIWMREGAPTTQSSRSKGRGSPDLCRFPSLTSQGSLRPGSVNGRVKGSGSADSPQSSLPPGFDYMRDLFSLRQGLFANTAPPAPNRRSSLHAGTGSSAASDCQSSERGSSSARRRNHQSRHTSVDVGRRDDLRTPVQRDQSASVPPQPQLQPQAGSDQKQRSHPPVSGGHSQGARTGLNRLFRRSTLSASPTPLVFEKSAGVDSPETVKDHDAMGLPSRTSRGAAGENDRSGATPPPIMLNARQMRRNTLGGEGEAQRPVTHELRRSKTPGPSVAAAAAVAVAQQEAAAAEDGPAALSGTGMRRKWLPGFSRTSNSRNKTG
ncbi:hypothetical protein E4U53_005726 [Claviceps sorghi]|nr:hypothetical protein E4U53_005726 [Claviceps sorghi]